MKEKGGGEEEEEECEFIYKVLQRHQKKGQTPENMGKIKLKIKVKLKKRQYCTVILERTGDRYLHT